MVLSETISNKCLFLLIFEKFYLLQKTNNNEFVGVLNLKTNLNDEIDCSMCILHTWKN